MLKTVFAMHSRYLPSLLWLLLPYALIILALLGMGEEKFEHLHLVLDISNAILSLLLMLFLLGEQHQIPPNVRQYLVIGFGFAAATELLHALIGIEWSGWFAWVQIYSGILRPATWPPSTYVLPLAMAWTYWLMRRNSTLRPALFAAWITLLTAGLLALSLILPRYVDTGILGIQRPTQAPLLLLWVGVIAVYWRERRTHPLFEGLALMGVVLFLSDMCMLYSTSPHEKFTMMAHVGKMIAYTLLHVIQMRIAAEDSRGRSAAEQALILEKERLQGVLNELALYNQVLQQISLGITLPKALDELARRIEAQYPGMLCSLLLLDEDGRHLRHIAAPSLPDFYTQAINGLAIGDGIGACGTAAYRGERVVVADVQQHEYWPDACRNLARQAGVQSCWSQPIKDSNGRVLGTFAIYHSQPGAPSDAEIALIERYADFAALVIERIGIQVALRESEERFRQLAENIHEVFWLTDPAKNKMLYISSAYEQVWGRPLQSLCDSSLALLEFTHDDDRQRVLHAATRQAVGLYDEEYRIVRPNGEIRWIHDRAYPVSDDAGVVYRIAGVAEDITERKQIEAELRIAATAFESQDGMTITDANNVILRVNHAFSKITGYAAEEAVGQTPRLLSSGRHDVAFYASMWASILHTGAWHGEIWNKRKNGEIYPEQLTITAVKNDSGETTNYIATLRDITERKQAEEQIRTLAFYDSLTQLPNRRLLNDRLGKAMAANKRSGRHGALMFLDLDNFKPLNDAHGHNMGDLLLVEVAHRLTSCVREVDTVARFGGDEFVVMLCELDVDKIKATGQADTVAEKIRRTLARPYRLKIQQEGKAETTVEHHCAASIGVVVFNSASSAEDVLKWSDMAMYQAKELGRNRVHFYQP